MNHSAKTVEFCHNVTMISGSQSIVSVVTKMIETMTDVYLQVLEIDEYHLTFQQKNSCFHFLQ